MAITKKRDLIEIYNLEHSIEYINNLNDFERKRHLLGVVATLLYNCLKKEEFGSAVKGIIENLKNLPKFRN